MSKILYTATVLSHICQFHLPYLEELQKRGHVVHVAARDNLNEKNGLKLAVSQGYGETEDPYAADFAAAVNADWIRAGAPCRSERTSKYNELLRIEEWMSGYHSLPASICSD